MSHTVTPRNVFYYDDFLWQCRLFESELSTKFCYFKNSLAQQKYVVGAYVTNEN